MFRYQGIFVAIAYLLVLMIACRNADNTGRHKAPSKPEEISGNIQGRTEKSLVWAEGAIIRGDTNEKRIALVFTGDEFGDGGEFILHTLSKQNIKASFFLTGNFYRNSEFVPLIQKLKENGNYLGSHSDKHLLYCDWSIRDSLLVSKTEFVSDLKNSYLELNKFQIAHEEARYFLPPFEWYNDSIAAWTSQLGLQLVNFTPGSGSNADYTYPEMGSSYADSKSIFRSVMAYERKSSTGMNGFILLVHIGTDPRRTDKFYNLLPDLITELKSMGYQFVRIDELLD